MSKEKQALAAGLQLGEDFAILTLFGESMKEPVTGEHAQARDSGRYMIPMDPKVWKAACGRELAQGGGPRAPHSIMASVSQE